MSQQIKIKTVSAKGQWTAGRVIVAGQTVHITRIYPYGMTQPARAAARAWAMQHCPALLAAAQ